MSAQTSARRAAVDLLVQVLDKKTTLDQALVNTKSYSNLEGSDRGFARATTSATLRYLGFIDFELANLIDRPLDQLDQQLRALLRSALAQLWILKTPDHAVVSESVDVAKASPALGKTSGLVNAVLRRAIEVTEPFTDLAPVHVWPRWFQLKVISDLGTEDANLLAEAQLDIPPLDLSFKPGKLEPDEWPDSEQLDDLTLRLHDAKAVERLSGYEDGNWWVQDYAASLPAKLLNAEIGDRVFDLCAAPGGKTMQLAASGFDVVAIDQSRARTRRLKANLKRTSLNTEIVEADVRSWVSDAPADLVLLDAPCSALGTLRRHPEGSWIKSPQDLQRFPGIQLDLLKAAKRLLKPEGTLIYCVCTPLREEGRDVVDAAIELGLWERQKFDEVELGTRAPFLTNAGDLLTLPGRIKNITSHDAFFISRLKPVQA